VFKKHKVRAQKPYTRIDRFLSETISHLSRTQIEKLITDHRVWLNQKPVIKKNTEIATHDYVEIEFPQAIPTPGSGWEAGFKPTIQFSKLFEDDHLLVIDKPSGIPVHPGAGPVRETILDIFRHEYPLVEEMKNTDRPGIVHRLDKETSGILILAKDEVTLKRMQKKFKNRQINKKYLALVSGKMRHRNGLIDAPIIRHPKQRKKFTVPGPRSKNQAREAITKFSVLLEFSDTSFLQLNPSTGRTHQLRVHLSHYGHPILGDPIYGKKDQFGRLALHASSIEFTHPHTGNHLTVEASMPFSFRKHIQTEIKKKKNLKNHRKHTPDISK
jgi:23S rRNA pseudouridine1911/1915/1917 synthase